MRDEFFDQQDWRYHGKERRKKLLREDKMQGGTSFTLNPKVPIKYYFNVGERVSFLAIQIDGARYC
jgi:hypothetical protein